MQTMRAFRTVEQALSACDVQIADDDKMTHPNGMPVFKHSPFQFRDIVVKEKGRIKFQIQMQNFY